MAGTWPLDGMEGELTAQRDSSGFAVSQWQVGRFAGCIALTGLPEEARGGREPWAGITADMPEGGMGAGVPAGSPRQ